MQNTNEAIYMHARVIQLGDGEINATSLFLVSDQGQLLHLKVIEHAQEASSACACKDLHGLLDRLLPQIEEEVGRHMCWPRSQIVGGCC